MAAGLSLTGPYGEWVFFLKGAIRREDARGGMRSSAFRNALAYMHLMANDLTSARIAIQQAADARQAHRNAHPFMGETNYLLGVIALEMDLLDEAEEFVQRVVSLLYQSPDVQCRPRLHRA